MESARIPGTTATAAASSAGPLPRKAPPRGVRFAAVLAAGGDPPRRGNEMRRTAASSPPTATSAARRPDDDGAAHASARARDARERPDDDGGDDGGAVLRGTSDDAHLDPQARHLAQLAPPVVPFAASAAPSTADAPARARSLEELVPQLVRRIAWAGDGKRGTVRLELGSGAWAGANVVVHADGGRVRVELGGLDERELADLRTRLATRLRGRGIDLEAIS